jgi:hypothetical protein
MNEMRWALQNVLKSLAKELEPAWVAGLALFQIWLGGRWLPLKGEAYEWAQYLLLGTVFPAVVLAVCVWSRSDTRSRIWLWLKGPLVAFCLLFPLLRTRNASVAIVILVAMTLGLTFLLLVRRSERQSQEKSIHVGRVIAWLIVAGIAWLASIRFIWWRSISAELTNFHGGHFWREWAILLGSALLTLGGLFYERRNWPESAKWLFWLTTPIALAVIGLASLRIDPFPGHAFHHWSAIVGPAELVRQGGWLLWDVPCQYGFLSTLTVAFLPSDNVWQSLYVLNSIMLFFSGVFLFLMLRSFQSGFLGTLSALAVTLAAVLLIPGFAPAATGPWAFPAVGAFRFFWCYALLAVLVWESRTTTGGRGQRAAMFAGCFVWLLACLWSVESSTYCAAIWLPAFCIIVWRRKAALSPEVCGIRQRVFRCIPWLTLPVVLLAVSFGAIHAYYSSMLGHGPDWVAWTEYARAFAGGYYALPIDRQGTIWALLLVFALASCAIAIYIRHQQCGDQLALLCGAWGALWAVSSYFVSRSHENNCTCLSPFLCLTLAIVLFVFAERLRGHSFEPLLRLSVTPLFILVIAASFGDRSILGNFLHDLPRGYVRHVERRLPLIDPALAELLTDAGVSPRDPLVFLESEATQSVLLAAWPSMTRAPEASTYTAWLPAAPAVLLAPLPEDRRQIYCRRFAERTQMDGWLIEPVGPLSPSMTWFLEQIRETHVVGEKCHRNSHWQVRRVEFKSPARLAGLHHEPPAELVTHGE